MILGERKPTPLVSTSWWSGGDSNSMSLADAFAGMRHFSIERDYLFARFRRRLLDRFYEPRRALWRSLGERPRRSPGLGEPRAVSSADTTVRCASRGFSRDFCRQAVRGWRAKSGPDAANGRSRR